MHSCFELGKSIKLVSAEIGYTRAGIYVWRKKNEYLVWYNEKEIKIKAGYGKEFSWIFTRFTDL